MTITNINDLVKEIPARANQILEISNRGCGLISRLLQMPNLDLELYDKILESVSLTCEYWVNLESVWKHYAAELLHDDLVLTKLEEISVVNIKIYGLALTGTHHGDVTEKDVLLNIQENLENFMKLITSV
jgi:hypothetical protein